ncbi:DUF4224 domain-containing protein [Pseudomonas denitrificans (nom. rej.)]|uniref:DUF4224 domain-containing protein n=1 Tax=Pseudomonas denitrificans TaxID=43306 RepID=A0A9X7MYK7_PSEDE|nr:DUF4224 domain-containing protein [Pseudomonas denitrificans (nom. rej.)]QEY70460.1 DUF4224 domain-containing protein [Pseudomonas denitrificans (nom. rej.)]
MFMTPEEVADLTGRTRASAQIRWLDEHLLGYVLDANGRPKVLREVVLSRLGSSKQQKKEPRLRLTGS